MTDAYIGIDPGKTGAACLLTDEETLFLRWDDDEQQMVEQLIDWKVKYNIRCVIIEKVGAMPGQGVTSMFTFGSNTGWWKGAISVLLGQGYMEVTPKKWQKVCLDDGKEHIKVKSVRVANALGGFGFKLTKNGINNGKADAYHMARYAKKIFKECV
jgi:hypothetical protein